MVKIVSHSHNGHSDTKYHHEQIPRVVLGNVFSWSYSHTGKTGSGVDDDVKKIIDIFNFEKRLLSLDMKTKVVQHVPRSKLDNLKT